MAFAGINRLLTINSNAISLVQRTCSTTFQQNLIRPREFQRVNLIGTICNEPFVLENGAKIISVKTVSPDNYSKTHRVIIGSPNLLNMLGENLSEGQRVYISGTLQSRPFLTKDALQRESFVVRAGEVFASKLNQSDVARTESFAEDEPAEASNRTVDRNSVSILSYIADIVQIKNFTMLRLSSHFTAKNPVNGFNEKTSFYSVFVHDKNLNDYVKNYLQRGDRVIVNGDLGYKKEIDQSGKKVYCGSIDATQIVKVDKLSNANAEIIDKTGADLI